MNLKRCRRVKDSTFVILFCRLKKFGVRNPIFEINKTRAVCSCAFFFVCNFIFFGENSMTVNIY